MLVALTIGIVGLPNVGKSTLFNALTRTSVLAANYPFATIEPNVGVVHLPDPRLDKLAEIFGSASDRCPATGVLRRHRRHRARARREGEGLGNKFLANIREADAICQVVRVFADADVDPRRRQGRSRLDDIETINTELILADLQTIEKAVPRIEKEVKRQEDASAELARRRGGPGAAGSAATPLSASSDKLDDRARSRELGLLTAKPFIYVFNVDEDESSTDTEPQARTARRSWPRPTRCSWTPSSRPSCSSSTRQDAAEMLRDDRPGRIRAGPARPRRLPHPRPADLPHRRAQGVARVDHPPGRHRPAGGRRDPHRLRARLHQGRGRLLRRPRRGRLHGRGARPAARSASRARNTSWPTATSWRVSNSASTSDPPRGSAVILRRVIANLTGRPRFSNRGFSCVRRFYPFVTPPSMVLW